jgi:PAS domain S-box-containing protein
VSPPDATAEDFEDLFENAPCGYLSLQADGRIHKANTTFSSWTGFSRAELLGKRFHELLNVAGKIYYETHFAPLLRMQGYFNEVALDLLTKEGQRLSVLVNALERRDDTDQPLCTRLIVFNATDRRRYERELLEARANAESASTELQQLNATLESRVTQAVAQQLQAEEALRHSQKFEAIGQLTGGVAHDFNNLLTVIIGGLDTIARQIEQLPPTAELARMRRARDMAQHGARRAATMTARLLALSRQQSLSPTAINVNRLLSDVADLLQRTLGETIAFETVNGAGAWHAFADAGELENVLINLAINARDAMPHGGRLTIETSNARLDDAYVSTLAEPVAAGQYVLIAVSDTGHGMDQETLARVFEPFFTTKEIGKGTGLGLALAYAFVRQSGGHVRIYSEVGSGTTVKLYLPKAASVEARVEPAAASVPSRLDGSGETILVVEDDEDLRAFSTEALQELGYNVLQARSGRAALQILQTDSDIALLFTDLVLPDGMNGKQLADEALRRRPGLKVLFTTGYALNAIVHHGRLNPGLSVLSKPFTFEELALKCRSMLD